MISNGDHHFHNERLTQHIFKIGFFFYIMFDVSSYHPLIHLQLKHSHQPSEFMNSRHDCENCWGPSLSLDDFYSLETRERGKIMGDCNIECDATVTRPRLRWWPGPGLVPSLISLPIKSCRNISNWSISEEKKEEGGKNVPTWAAVTFQRPNLFSDWSW